MRIAAVGTVAVMDIVVHIITAADIMELIVVGSIVVIIMDITAIMVLVSVLASVGDTLTSDYTLAHCR